MFEFSYCLFHILAQLIIMPFSRRKDSIYVSDLDFVKSKNGRSKALCILAAGQSAPLASRLAIEDGDCDFIAVSYGALLKVPFIASIHEYAPILQQSNQRIVFREIGVEEVNDLDDSIIIWKSKQHSDVEKEITSKKISYLSTIYIPLCTDDNLRRIFKLIKFFKINHKYIIQAYGVGSLSAVFGLADFLKYTKIRLGGVDLINKKYFFEEDEYSHLNLENPFKLEGDGQVTEAHPNLYGDMYSFFGRISSLLDGKELEFIVKDTPLAMEYEEYKKVNML